MYQTPHNKCIRSIIDITSSYVVLGKGDDEWEGTLMVYQEDFLSALNNLTPSVTKEELEKYRDKKSFTTLET